LAAEEGSLEGNQVKGRITQTTRKSDRREQIIRYIEEKLGAEETVTQKGISEEFEVSILTVRRDLKAINNSAVEPVYLVDELGRISRSR
jgi:predicted DNA-binding transcriptional regulator YafY